MNISRDSSIQIYTGEHLGTHLRIEAESFDGIEKVFKEISAYLEYFEARYSRFILGNWLTEINTNGGGILDTPAREMLEVALELAELTDGAFDPTIMPDLLRIGYGSISRLKEMNIDVHSQE
jgi:thiamine biosynthesis lipoprotein ApbE